MHTEKQLITSLTRDNEVIEHLLALKTDDDELFREIIEILEDLVVDPHMDFGPSYSLSVTRKNNVERKIRKRLNK